VLVVNVGEPCRGSMRTYVRANMRPRYRTVGSLDLRLGERVFGSSPGAAGVALRF